MPVRAWRFQRLATAPARYRQAGKTISALRPNSFAIAITSVDSPAAHNLRHDRPRMPRTASDADVTAATMVSALAMVKPVVAWHQRKYVDDLRPNYEFVLFLTEFRLAAQELLGPRRLPSKCRG
jgi:hypothetical protein